MVVVVVGVRGDGELVVRRGQMDRRRRRSLLLLDAQVPDRGGDVGTAAMLLVRMVMMRRDADGGGGRFRAAGAVLDGGAHRASVQARRRLLIGRPRLASRAIKIRGRRTNERTRQTNSPGLSRARARSTDPRAVARRTSRELRRIGTRLPRLGSASEIWIPRDGIRRRKVLRFLLVNEYEIERNEISVRVRVYAAQSAPIRPLKKARRARRGANNWHSASIHPFNDEACAPRHAAVGWRQEGKESGATRNSGAHDRKSFVRSSPVDRSFDSR